ncbi:prohead protease [Pectobacterium phage MA12]|uniref:Prohead protease n=1 Tax=Pectobacterium phage MA12 TaxID=2686474 RepID=A0A6B9RH36_9CAUD|nr:head maturation protease [Pectobacterium phage MA11]YP_010000253.1 head maturation protease [Pectobacterium phage MA12]QGF21039.1 capsid maturation protease [Pectobacterium phage MA11]QHI00858.1 prohead protease [Pectobacterium phage MA12]
MSESAARAALSRMNMRPAAIAPVYTELASDLQKLSQVTPARAKEMQQEVRAGLMAQYGDDDDYEDQVEKPFYFSSGMAIIPVSGSLINRFGGSYGWITGYSFIQRQLNLALGDPDVKGIIFDVNSYGGEAAGCFELADLIFEARSIKPSMAVVDSNCYSAAYAIASAAGRVVVTPSGGAGSIGVVAMHVDYSKMMEDWGLKVTFIHAGAHKVDGNPYEELSKEVQADVQASVNKSYDMFVNAVARNRDLTTEAVKATEARVYRADEALSLGLIDAVATPGKALQGFYNELSGSTIQLENSKMPQENLETKPAVVDQAALDNAHKAGQVAERARIGEILGHASAEGKTKMAHFFAFKTDMSVADAVVGLEAAALEVAVAPAKEEKAELNPLKQAMDNTQQPNIEADGTEVLGEGKENMSAADRILANQRTATGAPVKH